MWTHLVPLRASAFLVGIAVVLTGCSILPGYGDAKIDTARKVAVRASADVRSGYLLLENLLDSQAVDASTGRTIQTNLDRADHGIQATFDAIRVGADPSSVESNLERALLALNLALSLLDQYNNPGG